VHKHLLSARSKLLEARIKASKNNYLDWTMTSLDLPAASRYLGFLYGNPMWTYVSGADINGEWCALAELYRFAEEYEDFDAADACIDGMREMLQYRRVDPKDPGMSQRSLFLHREGLRDCPSRRFVNEKLLSVTVGPAITSDALGGQAATSVLIHELVFVQTGISTA
jgi:hypothetical protein